MGLMANRPLVRPVADMGFHSFRRPLEQDATMRRGAA